jgi:hypothetical protein
MNQKIFLIKKTCFFKMTMLVKKSAMGALWILDRRIRRNDIYGGIGLSWAFIFRRKSKPPPFQEGILKRGGFFMVAG